MAFPSLVIAYVAYTLFAWTPPSLTKAGEALHYPRWYWVLAGIMAAIGGVGLLVGLAFPVIESVAVFWTVRYFVVASFTHAFRQDWKNLGASILFLAIFVGMLVLRWADANPILAFFGL